MNITFPLSKVMKSTMLALSTFAFTTGTLASTDKAPSSGEVKVEDSGVTKPVDPENPEKPVDPNKPTKPPKGSLRIDFVSDLDFGRVKIDDKNRQFNAKAQLFKDDTEARGQYIQITDVRSESTGWTLMMEQKNQFVTDDGDELIGSVLSYDNAWANASHMTDEIKPDVTRETLSLVPNESVIVAQAERNKGWGVWTIEFGGAIGNGYSQKETLYPLEDDNGNPIINSEFNKPEFGNRAVSLSVPGTTNILPKQYKTEIIWTIAKLP